MKSVLSCQCMMKSVFHTVILCEVILHVNAVVNVMRNDSVIVSFEDESAEFGGSLPKTGIRGKIVYLKPTSEQSCLEYEPLPYDNKTCWIALIERRQSTCKFVYMVLGAQRMGYRAVIVHNNKQDGSNLVKMASTEETQIKASEIFIPSVFVGYQAGVTISSYANDSQYYVKIELTSDPESTSILLRIVIGLVLSIFLMLCGIVLICRKLRLENRQSTKSVNMPLPKYEVRKSKFTKDHRYSTCPICLGDFINREKLWILKCEHEFHAECIKPWLKKNNKSCPVCRKMSIGKSTNECQASHT